MALSSLFKGWQRPSLPAVIAATALAWAGLASAADKTAADYFVHSLPGAPDGPLVKMHAGHIEINPDHNSNVFFWHFQNKHIANKQRTVIWINGGPGCSSEDGALMEIGPYRLKDENTLVYNNGSWNEFANVLFVDNPVGTGYSYVDTDSYVTELDDMAAQFVAFLEKWYQIFPEYEHDDIYIAGESYAGQHIPYITKHILERNKAPYTEHIWNLKGLLIGNGWISPPDQYPAYLTFAYEKGLVKQGSDLGNRLEAKHQACEQSLKDMQGAVDIAGCEGILSEILRQTVDLSAPSDRQCFNMYDVRLKDSFPSCGMNWPPDLEYVTPYLRRADVTSALHVNPQKNTGWTECNGAVGSAFRARNSVASISLLPDILKEVPIILFSGAEDLICNHFGTESLISNMQWNSGHGFELSPGNWAPRRQWTFEGQVAGFWQEARNLTYVLYQGSSHMVPFDYPRRTRDMLDRFMGVDISSIGGTPTDSRLDGEKGPETTVGGAAGNGTEAQEAEKAKLDAVKWEAYRKSGEIVLVIVIIAAGAWGWYVWRDRRRRAGYQGVLGGDPERGTGRRGGGARGAGIGGRILRIDHDLEAADFDEGQLDDLHVATSTEGADGARYSVGEDSEDEEASAPATKKEKENEQHSNGNGTQNAKGGDVL